MALHALRYCTITWIIESFFFINRKENCCFKKDKRTNKKAFNFVNQGFNLRPLETSAAIALSQLKRIKSFKKVRKENRNKIIKELKTSSNWNNQYIFFEASKNLDPSWFGMPFLINKKFLSKKKIFLQYLEKNKVETRPIISGNFANQASVKLHKIKFNLRNLKNAHGLEGVQTYFDFSGFENESATVEKNIQYQVQEKNKDVDIGSYPFFKKGRIGVSIVLRSRDQSKIDICNSQILEFIKEKKIEIVERD